MDTSTALMDAWRNRSNKAYRELIKATNAPGLFKQNRIDQLKSDLDKAEKNFNFWRDNA